ncbi:calcium/sodium antiporter [Congregibacter variabilis]|uniref:Calcium/sodium antiporter n=1 Tax=Congregibacter variabilis TaxID=3081200 RepID=A0ABZ0I7F8_9GAMM|nr:calcium/sodium antiporter [Congregibacter sp. IMCC43200]
MLIPLLTILIAFAILMWSADMFVAGAASIAGNLGMSPVVIGLTIVSLGTSAPEILVSVTAALAGSGGLAIGNAVGSNIANIGLVLGITVLIAPIQVHPGCMRSELPTLLVVTAGTGLLLLDVELGRSDAILMITALVLILAQMIRAQVHDPKVADEAKDEELPQLAPGKAWTFFGIGLVLLMASSKTLVWGASAIAMQFGVSELIIGLTIVAVGTSLPELAATLASALRGHAEIAIGNIVGSNLFNLLAVMAMPGLLSPEQLPINFLLRDYGAMCIATILMAAAAYHGLRHPRAKAGHSYLGRALGTLFCAGYALYYYWLYITL